VYILLSATYTDFFLTPTQALVQPGSLAFDPFVGTGSILIALSSFGALPFGAEVDANQLNNGARDGDKDDKAGKADGKDDREDGLNESGKSKSGYGGAGSLDCSKEQADFAPAPLEKVRGIVVQINGINPRTGFRVIKEALAGESGSVKTVRFVEKFNGGKKVYARFVEAAAAGAAVASVKVIDGNEVTIVLLEGEDEHHYWVRLWEKQAQSQRAAGTKATPATKLLQERQQGQLLAIEVLEQRLANCEAMLAATAHRQQQQCDQCVTQQHQQHQQQHQQHQDRTKQRAYLPTKSKAWSKHHKLQQRKKCREDKRERKGRSLFSNFSHYQLPMPELILCDAGRMPLRSVMDSWPTRERSTRAEIKGSAGRGSIKGSAGRGSILFDAIVTDPPYFFRNRSAKKQHGFNISLQQPKRADQEAEEVVPKQEGLVGFEAGSALFVAVIDGLLNLAATSLRCGGRLVYLLPCPYGFDNENLPAHPCLRLVASSEQPITPHYARRVITMEKFAPYDPGRHAQGVRPSWDPVPWQSNAEDLQQQQQQQQQQRHLDTSAMTMTTPSVATKGSLFCFVDPSAARQQRPAGRSKNC
jgi:hypothetical protein